MNRRDFFKVAAAGGAVALHRSRVDAGLIPETSHNFKTRHVIWIINGNGSRKKDWYENPSLCPNYARLATEGFVYEESHNDTVSRHEQSWVEAITGNRFQPDLLANPTPLHYVRKAYNDRATNYWYISGASSFRQWKRDPRYFSANHPEFGENTRPVLFNAAFVRPDRQFQDAGLSEREKSQIQDFIQAMVQARVCEVGLKEAPIPREPFVGDALGFTLIPEVMKAFKPRILIYHQVGHDVAHGAGGYPRLQTGYSEYEKVCRTTDKQLGRIFDFVKNDPYFSKTTTIVIRPEFGRDDEITRYGELHHSTGYYQAHRSAEIWWGPDIKVGADKTLKNRMDLVPTLTKLFNVNAPYAIGQVHPEMFKDTIGDFAPYQPYLPECEPSK
jgi:hypothetical protein